MWRATFLILLVLGACMTSSAGARVAPVRGFSRGFMTLTDLYPTTDVPDTTLAAGAAVALADGAPPGCAQVGFVTGLAAIRDREETAEALLDDATNDARNRAAPYGDRLVIDAHET